MKRSILLLVVLILSYYPLYSQNGDGSLTGKHNIARFVSINIQANVLQSLTVGDSTGKQNYLLGNSFSAGLEVSTKYKNAANYGIGGFYQFPNNVEFTNGKLGIVPVYALLDYPLLEGKSPLLLSLRFGYAFITASDDIQKPDGGIYHAIGFSMEISQRIILKLLYANNYGKINTGGNNYQMRNSSIGLSLNFNL